MRPDSRRRGLTRAVSTDRRRHEDHASSLPPDDTNNPNIVAATQVAIKAKIYEAQSPRHDHLTRRDVGEKPAVWPRRRGVGPLAYAIEIALRCGAPDLHMNASQS